MDDDSMAESAGEDVGIDVEADSAMDADATEPVAWARPDATGVASVDAAIAQLAQLDQLPTSEHVAVYDGLHRQLQDALADLDGA